MFFGLSIGGSCGDLRVAFYQLKDESLDGAELVPR